MKKTLLLAIAATCISLVSYSQINKGSVLLGGSIGGSTTKFDQGASGYKSNSLNLSPSVGVTIQTNTVLGLSLSYGHSKAKNDPSNNVSQEINSYGGGIFLRRYKSLSKNFYLFGEAAIGYNYAKDVQTSFAQPNVQYINKQNRYGISLTPGIAYAVNKRIHLEATINSIASLNYISAKTYNSTTPSNYGKQSSLAFQTNLSTNNPLSLGIRIVLGK